MEPETAIFFFTVHGSKWGSLIVVEQLIPGRKCGDLNRLKLDLVHNGQGGNVYRWKGRMRSEMRKFIIGIFFAMVLFTGISCDCFTSSNGEYFLIKNASLMKRGHYSYIFQKDKNSLLLCAGWGEHSSRPSTLFITITSSSNKYRHAYMFESFQGGGIKEYDISNVVFLRDVNEMKEDVVIKFDSNKEKKKKVLTYVENSFEIEDYLKDETHKQIRIPIPIFWYNKEKWLERAKR